MSTTYTCSYPFDGSQHIIHVEAKDEAEASRRLRAIGMTAQIDGELVVEGSLRPLNWLASLRRWLGGRSS